MYPDDNGVNKNGGQSVPYGLSFSYTAGDFTSDVKTVLVTFPAEFSIPVSSLTCTPKFGFTQATVNCVVESQNRISIDTTGIDTGVSQAWVTVTNLKNPIVESGPFTFTVDRVDPSLKPAKQSE